MRLSPIWPVRGWRVFISLFFVVRRSSHNCFDLLRPAAVWYRIRSHSVSNVGLSLNTAAYAAETLRAAISLLIKVSGKPLPVLV